MLCEDLYLSLSLSLARSLVRARSLCVHYRARARYLAIFVVHVP